MGNFITAAAKRLYAFGNSFGTGSGGQFESAKTGNPRRQKVPGGTPTDQKRELRGGSRQQIVKTSRYLERNSGLKAESASVMAIYSVGDGMRPQSQCADADVAELYEEIFARFAVKPEITGRFALSETLNIASRTIDGDGEVFLVKTRDKLGQPKVQILETHNFSTETDEKLRLFDGIVYDSVGRPKYYLQNREDKNNLYLYKSRPIPANSVLHVFEPISASMSRAFPGGQHGFLKLQDELELLSNETVAVKDGQEVSRILKSNRDHALADGDFGMDEDHDDYVPTNETDISERIGGRTVRINESEALESFQSNRPNPMFDGFLELLERDAVGGHLPFEVTRNAKDIGGASVRLVTSKMQRRVRYRQHVLETRLLTPLWAYVIGDAIARGEVPAVKGWHKVKWTTPRSVTVDAGREASANRADVECGIKLISETIAEGGGDFDEHFKARANQARKILTLAGHPETEPIPLWMIYKPQGMPIPGEPSQNTPNESGNL